jgi:hypothetical protein
MFKYPYNFPSYKSTTQGAPGSKVNILGGHSIGHSKKKVHMNMCPIQPVSDIWRTVF